MGVVGLETAKVQLSELVSKVSSQCLNSAFQEVKELQGFCPQTNDCSMDSSCLTSCDRSQKEQDIQKGAIALRQFNNHVFMERKEQATEAAHLKKNTFLTPLMGKKSEENRSSYGIDGNLSMSIGIERETQKLSVDDRLTPSNYFAPSSRLDLNTLGDKNEAAATSCKQLDLNRFSWN